jgi:hypothetical protein
MTERHDETREEVVMNIEMTEHDRETMRLDTDVDPPGEPGVPGPRRDVDLDDAQMSEAASKPLK